MDPRPGSILRLTIYRQFVAPIFFPRAEGGVGVDCAEPAKSRREKLLPRRDAIGVNSREPIAIAKDEWRFGEEPYRTFQTAVQRSEPQYARPTARAVTRSVRATVMPAASRQHRSTRGTCRRVLSTAQCSDILSVGFMTKSAACQARLPTRWLTGHYVAVHAVAPRECGVKPLSR